MSWFHTGAIDTLDPAWSEKLRDTEYPKSVESDTQEEQDRQVKYGLETIEDLIDCRVIGTESDLYAYTISGHANPSNKIREGHCPDLINITLSQSRRYD